MQTLLSILLYLQVIQSPGTYSNSYINQLEAQYHLEIQNIQADPDQMLVVNQVYIPQVEHVIVINEWETYNTKSLRDCTYAQHTILIEECN